MDERLLRRGAAAQDCKELRLCAPAFYSLALKTINGPSNCSRTGRNLIAVIRGFAACGWVVQDRLAMNLFAARGIAVREFPLETSYADYLLFVDRHAAGIIEARPSGFRKTPKV